MVRIKLPNGLECEIGNDFELFYVVHEIFYKNDYRGIDLRNNDSVLDLGANVGLYTLWVAPQVKKVISVEPLLQNFRLLNLNIKWNDLAEKVTPVNKAVFSKKIKKKLFLSNSGAHASFEYKSNNSLEVETITIDELSHIMNVKPEILKIDIEGAEVEALKGASQTLERAREIIIECHSEELTEKVREILSSFGYSFHEKPSLSFKLLNWLKGYILLNTRQLMYHEAPDLVRKVRNQLHFNNRKQSAENKTTKIVAKNAKRP